MPWNYPVCELNAHMPLFIISQRHEDFLQLMMDAQEGTLSDAGECAPEHNSEVFNLGSDSKCNVLFGARREWGISSRKYFFGILWNEDILYALPLISILFLGWMQWNQGLLLLPSNHSQFFSPVNYLKAASFSGVTSRPLRPRMSVKLLYFGSNSTWTSLKLLFCVGVLVNKFL